MTEVSTRSARNDPAHRAGRVPCPAAGCGYTAEPNSSIAGHVAFTHPEIPMDLVAPRRPTPTTPAAAPEPTPDGSAPRALEADERATPGAAPAAGSATLPVAAIVVRDNIRFELGDLEDLAASIREHGLLQPLLVARETVVGDTWILVDGHRRYQAAILAELAEVPVHVTTTELAGGRRKTVQVEANAHRRDLNPLEQAQAYRDILDADGISQAELARRLAVAPPTIANALRLLEAAPKVQDLLRDGRITAAHAKAVIGLPADEQVRLAERGAAGSSAHQLESDAAYTRRLEADRKAKTKANAAALKHALAALSEAAVPAGTQVVVSVPYDMDGAGIRAAVAEAGWPTVDGWGDTDTSCGCTTRRVTCNGAKAAKVEAICLDRAHRDARQATKEAKRAETEQARELERQQLRGALLETLPRLGPTMLRLLLRHVEAYGGPTWTEYGKLDTADVVAKLAQRLANQHGATAIPTTKVVEALRAEAAS